MAGSDACANCQRCSRSAAPRGATAIGRGSLHLATGGLSLAASGLRRKCGICGHQRAEHRAELVANVGAAMQTQTPTADLVALQMEQQRQLAAAQWQAQQVQLAQLAALTNQAAPAPAQPELAGAPPVDMVERLQKLAALRDQGILTDEEFAAQKTKILEQG